MIYFISDVHLGYFQRAEDKVRENLLIEFFNAIRKDCEVLYIVGDLFDYWFEYKTVIPVYFYRTLAALSDLRKKNIKVEYLIGNHDFGHINFFENELDIPIYWNDIERTHYGKKFYISHGDGLSYNDQGYIILKKILRNSFLLKVYTKLHPNIGIGIALSSSRKSREYTGVKNYGPREGMIDFAEKKICEGFDYVIMGHRHIADIFDFKEGKYINLGEWLKNPHYGCFDGNNFVLEKVKDFLERR